jgi:hypothetical protein
MAAKQKRVRTDHRFTNAPRTPNKDRWLHKTRCANSLIIARAAEKLLPCNCLSELWDASRAGYYDGLVDLNLGLYS